MCPEQQSSNKWPFFIEKWDQKGDYFSICPYFPFESSLFFLPFITIWLRSLAVHLHVVRGSEKGSNCILMPRVKLPYASLMGTWYFFFCIRPCHRIFRSKRKDKNGQTSGIEMNLGYLPIVIRIRHWTTTEKKKRIIIIKKRKR